MKRKLSYWIWLLADLSLDRAATILPLIDFPPVDHARVQGCIDSLGEDLDRGQQDPGILGRVGDCLYFVLGEEEASAVNTWLHTFPFTDEASAPAPSYWELRFLDFLGTDPAPAPEGIDPVLWAAFMAAFRGIKPDADYPWAPAFREAACAILKSRSIARAIDEVHSARLTPHDLELYMRFGWNDYGIHQGLSSLDIGAGLAAVISFWRAVYGYIPAEVLEAFSYRRDMEDWERGSNPANFIADAREYGVSPAEMAATMFPKPSWPPRLSALLEKPAVGDIRNPDA